MHREGRSVALGFPSSKREALNEMWWNPLCAGGVACAELCWWHLLVAPAGCWVAWLKFPADPN